MRQKIISVNILRKAFYHHYLQTVIFKSLTQQSRMINCQPCKQLKDEVYVWDIIAILSNY